MTDTDPLRPGSPDPGASPPPAPSGRTPAEQASFARLYMNARREAVVTLVAWLASLTWTVGYCYLRGYQHAADSWVVRQGWATTRGPEDLRMVLGFPDWIFFGIVLPWVACTLFTLVYSLWGISDDDLGAEGEEPHHES